MKKILSTAAIALFAFSVLFTACRNDAGTTQTPAAEPAPAATVPADTAAQEAAAPAAADTTKAAQ